MDRETIRTYRTKHFRAEVFVFPEDLDPADTIAFGEDEESQQAEREYLDKIYRGALPWVVIGVRILADGGEELGSAYLGGCDFLPGEGYGREVVRELASEAIEEARQRAKALCLSLANLRSA